MKFKQMQQWMFIGLLGVVSVAFLWVIKDYIMPIFWALVFAILFIPLHKRLLETVKIPSLTSAVTIILILVMIIVPLLFIGSLVVKESLSIYQSFNTQNEEQNMTLYFGDTLSHGLAFVETFGVSQEQATAKIAEYTGAFTNWFANQLVSFGGKTFTITLQFFIMIYVLFFLLRDGDHIKQRVIDILPLGDRKEKKLLAKFVSTTRAVIKGTLVVGAIQGTIGGILFAIAGIKGAILWGVLMTILSVVPAVGAVIIWLPAAIILLLSGSIWEGLLVLIGGGLVISLIDNILRPILVGKDTKMPDVFILLSTLGGLSVFGITGFVIGPIIAGFFIVMWDMFEEEYKIDLKLYG